MKQKTVHAVIAVDPGRTTGVAAGYFDLKPTLKETLRGGTNKKAIEVPGQWLAQSRELHGIVWRFVFRANVDHQLPLDNIHLVIEDFVLRRRQAGGATGDLTSIWVAAALCGSLVSPSGSEGSEVWPPDPFSVYWQQPSSAKSLATNERLKLWDLYEVGSEHKRDAWRHVALRVNRILSER